MKPVDATINRVILTLLFCSIFIVAFNYFYIRIHFKLPPVVSIDMVLNSV